MSLRRSARSRTCRRTPSFRPASGYGICRWVGIFRITEGKTFLARVEAYDVFNHRNFTVAGPVSVFSTLTGNNALNAGYNTTTSPTFLDPKQFSGGGRALQLTAKFIF